MQARFLLLLPLALPMVFVGAQEPQGAPRVPPPTSDVGSIEGTVAALYNVISGPAGPRNWERFRGLFHPEQGRLMPVRPQQGTQKFDVAAWTPADYQERAGAFFAQNPFYESELSQRTEQYGHIAHVFSTYESRTAPDAEPFDRGINSIQMVHDGVRWWILSVTWDSESGAGPIPERYLSTKKR
ncbi:MAG TPA: hypothetical protein VGC54_10550 [Planctomycetota bacterium]